MGYFLLLLRSSLTTIQRADDKYFAWLRLNYVGINAYSSTFSVSQEIFKQSLNMPVDTREIIELLSQLADEDRLRVAVTEALKGGLIAGLATIAGGLLFGPPGLAVGGAVGGCVAACTSKQFLSVVEIIQCMEEEKKERLAENIRGIMANLNVTDVAPFAAMMMGDTALRNRVVGELVDYLRTEMSLAVLDH